MNRVLCVSTVANWAHWESYNTRYKQVVRVVCSISMENQGNGQDSSDVEETKIVGEQKENQGINWLNWLVGLILNRILLYYLSLVLSVTDKTSPTLFPHTPSGGVVSEPFTTIERYITGSYQEGVFPFLFGAR